MISRRRWRGPWSLRPSFALQAAPRDHLNCVTQKRSPPYPVTSGQEGLRREKMLAGGKRALSSSEETAGGAASVGIRRASVAAGGGPVRWRSHVEWFSSPAAGTVAGPTMLPVSASGLRMSCRRETRPGWATGLHPSRRSWGPTGNKVPPDCGALGCASVWHSERAPRQAGGGHRLGADLRQGGHGGCTWRA